jgi:hypothetical protein
MRIGGGREIHIEGVPGQALCEDSIYDVSSVQRWEGDMSEVTCATCRELGEL